MVKEIVRDIIFLQQKSDDATKADLYIAKDLLDTINANADRCVGLAANMIGYKKRILVALINDKYTVMINPKIVSHTNAKYDTMEGCLSLVGQRPTTRYNAIEVEFSDTKLKKKKLLLKGYPAQIVQHEMDHFEGIII